MLDINVVSDYICYTFIEMGQKPTVLQIQKLLYYAQAWYLVIYDSPLFKGEFQAWVHGPVSPEIYERFKTTKSMFSLIEPEDIKEDFEALDADRRYHIDAVLESYGHLTGTQLEELTHNESPWKNARKNLGPYDRSTNPISEEDMKVFYGKMQDQGVDASK